MCSESVELTIYSESDNGREKKFYLPGSSHFPVHLVLILTMPWFAFVVIQITPRAHVETGPFP